MTIRKLAKIGTVTLYRYAAGCVRCGPQWISEGAVPPLRCSGCGAAKFYTPARQYTKPGSKPKPKK